MMTAQKCNGRMAPPGVRKGSKCFTLLENFIKQQRKSHICHLQTPKYMKSTVIDLKRSTQSLLDYLHITYVTSSLSFHSWVICVCVQTHWRICHSGVPGTPAAEEGGCRSHTVVLWPGKNNEIFPSERHRYRIHPSRQSGV